MIENVAELGLRRLEVERVCQAINATRPPPDRRLPIPIVDIVALGFSGLAVLLVRKSLLKRLLSSLRWSGIGLPVAEPPPGDLRCTAARRFTSRRTTGLREQTLRCELACHEGLRHEASSFQVAWSETARAHAKRTGG